MPCDYDHLPHPGIRALSPYVPGKSIEELTKEKGITNVIKLASNENQLGCSPLVMEALSDLSPHFIASYPSPINHRIGQQLCDKLNINRDMLTLSNGSDALFSLIMNTFALHTNKHILTHDYAFISYVIQAQTLGIPVRISTVNQQFEVDIEDMISKCSEDTALIFIANPNNPTGIMNSLEEINRLLSSIPETTIIVLDEAYYEFAYSADDSSSLNLLKKYPNLIITRTFSKIYGLAALRLGYAIANPAITKLLNKVQAPFAVNQVVLEAASAALYDHHFVEHTLDMNNSGLKQMRKGLELLGLLVLPSCTNFLTFNCGMNCLTIYNELLEKGIIVRPLISYGLQHFLRVTIGTEEQNKRFLDELSNCIKFYHR